MDMIAKARKEMKQATADRMLIIEDEPMIALDLADMLHCMGHAVIGTAETYDEAMEIAGSESPDFILSDIKLANGSLGTDVVRDILRGAGDIPVIFITAYPELLLTGENSEPAFLINKPYSIGTESTAVSQAMFFASTDAIDV